MKLAVLGATGMAGHTISICLSELGYDVVAISRKEFPYLKNILLDMSDTKKLKDILIQGNFDAVINCVGILNQDAEDNKAEAVLLNAYLPHFLVSVLKETNTKVIHMSTDCVFSGREGNYKEDSIPDGQTFYDKTKALGEIKDNKNLTFRNSIVGPDTNKNGIGLFNWFMKQDGQINGFTKAIWSGVTTVTLAKAMDKALKENLTGLYNLVNDEPINKFELLNLFNKHMKNESVTILPSESIVLNKSLINTRNDFSFTVPSYEDMVIEMKEWIYEHKNLYPHYFNRG